MDVDSAVIYALLAEGQINHLHGLKLDYFDPEWRPVAEYVVEFFRKYKKLPTVHTVVGKFGVDFEEVKEPFLFYNEELRNRAMSAAIQEQVRQRVVSELERGDPHAAHLGLKETVAEISREFIAKTEDPFEVLDLRKTTKEREQWFQERKAMKGIMGIPTPWPSLTTLTGGWQSSDLVVFISRSGLGKTWIGILCAIDALKRGERVLFVTMETKPKLLSIRMDAVGAMLSIDRFRTGDLTTKEEKRWRKWKVWLRSKQTQGEFVSLGASKVRSVLDLELAIEEHRPTLVVWDAYYMAAPTRKWEHVATLFKDTKILADDVSLPIILNSQFNRKVATTDKEADQNVAGFTDAVVQDSTHAYSLFQPPDMEDVNEMLLRSLKTRVGRKLKEMIIRWNLQTMDFSEIMARWSGGSTGKHFENAPLKKKKGIKR